MTSTRSKINELKLTIDLLGYIIESVEDNHIKDMEWVESVENNNNQWKFTIKKQAKYYPACIKAYVMMKKKLTLEGSLYQIEEQLNGIYNKGKDVTL